MDKGLSFLILHFIRTLILFVAFINNGDTVLIKSSKDNDKNCQFLGVLRENGEYWLHQNFFNVTCLDGQTQVSNFWQIERFVLFAKN